MVPVEATVESLDVLPWFVAAVAAAVATVATVVGWKSRDSRAPTMDL